MDSSSDKRIHLLATDAIFQNSEIVKANLEREKEILAFADQIFNNEDLSIDEKITQLTDLKKDYLYTARADTFTMTSSGSLTSIQAREWFSDNQISKHIAYLESVKTGRPLVDLSTKLLEHVYSRYKVIEDTEKLTHFDNENESVESLLYPLSRKDRNNDPYMLPGDFQQLVKDITHLIEKKNLPKIVVFKKINLKAPIYFYCCTLYIAWKKNATHGSQKLWKNYIDQAFKNFSKGNLKGYLDDKFAQMPNNYSALIKELK